MSTMHKIVSIERAEVPAYRGWSEIDTVDNGLFGECHHIGQQSYHGQFSLERATALAASLAGAEGQIRYV